MLRHFSSLVCLACLADPGRIETMSVVTVRPGSPIGALGALMGQEE